MIRLDARIAAVTDRIIERSKASRRRYLELMAAEAEPLGEVRFYPTGGIRLDSAPLWLAHPSVRCVGGSWLVQPGETDPAAIGTRARAGALLERPNPRP